MGILASALGGGSSAAELEVNVRATGVDETSRAVDGLGGKLGGVGGLAAKAGAIAVTSGVAMAGAFGVKALMAASDLNEQVSKVGVVFGDSAKVVTGFAQRMANDFGLPKTQILEAASGIGLVGKASGLAQGDAARLGTSMAGLAADASSFYNVPLEEALTAIQSGLVGEAEPLRRYGVLLSEAAVQQEAVRLGIAKAGDELTEQQKVQARASLITKGMTDATGDLARTQDGLANRLREVQGRAMNFAADFGMKLIPLVLAGMDAFEALAGWVGPKLGAAFDAVRPVFERFVELLGFAWDVIRSGDDVVGGLAEVFDAMLGNTGKTIPVFYELGDAVAAVMGYLRQAWQLIDRGVELIGGWGTVLKVVGGAIGALAGAAVLGALTAGLGALMGVVIALAGVLLSPVALIGALAAALVIAYQRSEAFREVVQAVAGFLTGTVLPAIGAVVSSLTTDLGGAVQWATQLWAPLVEAVTHVWNVIQEVVTVALAVLQAAWGAFGDELLEAVRIVWDTVRQVVNAALDVVRGVIQTVLALINGDWGKAWDSILQVLRGVWDAAWAVIEGATRMVGQLLEGWLSYVRLLWETAWGAVGGFFTGAWGAIQGAVSSGIGAMVGFFVGLPGRILGAIGDLAGAFVGFVADAFVAFVKAEAEGALLVMREAAKIPGKILEGIGDLSRLLIGVAGDLIGGLVKGIKDAAHRVIDAIKDYVIDKLPGFVKKFLGISSPSKLFAGYGRNLMEGMALGIADASGLVFDQLADASRAVASVPFTLGDVGAVTDPALGGSTAAAAMQASMARNAALAAGAGSSATPAPLFVKVEATVDARGMSQEEATAAVEDGVVGALEGLLVAKRAEG